MEVGGLDYKVIIVNNDCCYLCLSVTSLSFSTVRRLCDMPTDLIVNYVRITWADWISGDGEALFLTGA